MAEEPHRGAPVTRLAVSVEGQTEEEFVKQVLAEHLRERQVESTPIVLAALVEGLVVETCLRIDSLLKWRTSITPSMP